MLCLSHWHSSSRCVDETCPQKLKQMCHLQRVLHHQWVEGPKYTQLDYMGRPCMQCGSSCSRRLLPCSCAGGPSSCFSPKTFLPKHLGKQKSPLSLASSAASFTSNKLGVIWRDQTCLLVSSWGLIIKLPQSDWRWQCGHMARHPLAQSPHRAKQAMASPAKYTNSWTSIFSKCFVENRVECWQNMQTGARQPVCYIEWMALQYLRPVSVAIRRFQPEWWPRKRPASGRQQVLLLQSCALNASGPWKTQFSCIRMWSNVAFASLCTYVFICFHCILGWPHDSQISQRLWPSRFVRVCRVTPLIQSATRNDSTT